LKHLGHQLRPPSKLRYISFKQLMVIETLGGTVWGVDRLAELHQLQTADGH